MQRMFMPLYLAVCFGILLGACTNDKQGTGDAVELKINLEKGDKVSFELVTEQDISAAGTNTTQTVGMGYSLEVTEKDVDLATVKTTYDWIQYEMSNMPNMSYDSRKEGQTGSIAELFSGLVGQSFTMKIDSQGKVSNVEGVDKLLGAMLQNVDSSNRIQMEASVNQLFNEEAITSSMQQITAVYPDKPVKVGTSWTQDIALAGAYPMKSSTQYTVSSITADEVVLKAEGKISTEEGLTVESGGMTMGISLSGTQTGDVYLSRKTGLPAKSNLVLKIGGKMEVMGQSIDMNIDSKVSIKAK